MPIVHNTQEKLAPSGFREIRRILLLLPLVLVAINVLLYFYVQHHSFNKTYWLLKTKWHSLVNTQPLQWLILGDSSGNQGVDPALFAATLGKAHNFCTFGDALVQNDLLMLKTYLEKQGPPQGVLLVHTYDIWHRGPNPQVLAQMPVPVTGIRDFMSGVTSRPRFFFTVLIERFLPLYSQPFTVRSLLARPHKAFAPRAELEANGLEVQRDPRPAQLEADLKAHLAFVADSSFTVSRANLRALMAICDLARTHDFPVYFALAPLYEKAVADSAFRGHVEELLGFLRETEASCPQFHLLEPLPITEPAAVLQSVDHVTAAGAEDYTRIIIGRIQADQIERDLLKEPGHLAAAYSYP